MTDLAKLVVKLEAQTAQYDAKLDAANAKLSRFEKTTNGHLGKMQASFGKFNKALGMVGVGVSFAAVTYGLASAAKKAIEFGDEMGKAAAKTGIAAPEFSELAYAAKQNDIELTALGAALKKFQVNISEAGSGSKAQLATFRALGIEFDDLRKLSPDKQFELVAEQISRLKDPADRTRAAVELFGKAGADLLPMFEDGASGIRKLREEAKELGATLTDEQVKKLQEADDAIKRLTQTWDGLARTLTAKVAPSLTLVLEAMTNALSDEPKVITFGQAWEAAAEAFRKNGIGTTWTDILAEIKAGEEIANKLTSKGPQQRYSRGGLPAPKGFEDEEAAKKAADAARKAAEEAERDRLKALEQQADAYKSILEAGVGVMNEMQSPAEQITARFEEQKFALEKLAETYPAFAAQAEEALARAAVAADEELEALKRNDEAYKAHLALMAEGQVVYEQTRTEIELWAAEMERLTELFTEGAISQDTFDRAIKKANEDLAKNDEITIFWEEASRNIQGLIADGLTNGFDDGAKGALRAFAQMIQQMMAQAIAAKIAQTLFGAAGAGSGGGWVGTAVSAIGSFFGGSRDSGGRGRPGSAYAIGVGAQPEMFVPDQPGNFMPADEWMGQMKPQVNLRNINAFEPSVIRDYLLSSAGEEVMLNFIERNGSRVRASMAGG